MVIGMGIGHVIVGTLYVVVGLAINVFLFYVLVTTCFAVKRYVNNKNTDQQKQIDELKHELEELKRKQ
jgi:uncharacterized membrane protein YfcA